MADPISLLPPHGAIAVIFISQRNGADEQGYDRAAAAMVARAAKQPGYLGIDSVRSADGLGITTSYWADESSALAWRTDAEHSAIRDMGRERWYADYRMIVTQVTRAYGWARAGDLET